MRTEDEVVRLAAQGNPDAFRQLVADHQRLVAHIVFRMVRDGGDREDLCQDVFVRVYQKLHTFRFESKLSTWIARLAYTVCLNHLAKRRIETTMDRLDVEELEASGNEGTRVELANTEVSEMRAFIRECVHDLPLPYRMAVTLHYLEDMSVQEIGETMEVPSGTVKSHLFRARGILRRQLLERYGAEEFRG